MDHDVLSWRCGAPLGADLGALGVRGSPDHTSIACHHTASRPARAAQSTQSGPLLAQLCRGMEELIGVSPPKSRRTAESSGSCAPLSGRRRRSGGFIAEGCVCRWRHRPPPLPTRTRPPEHPRLDQGPLRRHPACGTESGACSGREVVPSHRSDPEVDDHRRRWGEDDVRWLQVSMDHAAAVDLPQCPRPPPSSLKRLSHEGTVVQVIASLRRGPRDVPDSEPGLGITGPASTSSATCDPTTRRQTSTSRQLTSNEASSARPGAPPSPRPAALRRIQYGSPCRRHQAWHPDPSPQRGEDRPPLPPSTIGRRR